MKGMKACSRPQRTGLSLGLLEREADTGSEFQEEEISSFYNLKL